MKRNIVLAMTAVIILGFTVLRAPVAGESEGQGNKSVAWYVANIKEAKKQNQICFNDTTLQSTENCVNSLHALQISFKGNN